MNISGKVTLSSAIAPLQRHVQNGPQCVRLLLSFSDMGISVNGLQSGWFSTQPLRLLHNTGKSVNPWGGNPPRRNTGWICLCTYGSWMKALRRAFVPFFLFFKQSDTQVPLLLLVKAHHSLNVHTTLSGPSASVSGRTLVIYLPIYLSYLSDYFSVFSLPLFLLVS